jgi:hypothetical protein
MEETILTIDRLAEKTKEFKSCIKNQNLINNSTIILK